MRRHISFRRHGRIGALIVALLIVLLGLSSLELSFRTPGSSQLARLYRDQIRFFPNSTNLTTP